MTNLVSVIATDKENLERSIQQIFGFDNIKKYMEKFIHFEVELDYGIISEKIIEKYADYVALFDKEIFEFEDPVEECLQAIFKDIDIRTQEYLVKKAMLIHKLLYTDKKDYSFMCMELLLTVLICVYNNTSCFSNRFIRLNSFGQVFMEYSNSKEPAFAKFFTEKFEEIKFRKEIFTFSINKNREETYILPEIPNLYGNMLFIWDHMHKENPNITIKANLGVYHPIKDHHQELKKFAEMLRLIK